MDFGWCVVLARGHRFDRNSSTLWSGVVVTVPIVLVPVVLGPVASVVVDVAVVEVTPSTIAGKDISDNKI